MGDICGGQAVQIGSFQRSLLLGVKEYRSPVRRERLGN